MLPWHSSCLLPAGSVANLNGEIRWAQMARCLVDGGMVRGDQE